MRDTMIGRGSSRIRAEHRASGSAGRCLFCSSHSKKSPLSASPPLRPRRRRRPSSRPPSRTSSRGPTRRPPSTTRSSSASAWRSSRTRRVSRECGRRRARSPGFRSARCAAAKPAGRGREDRARDVELRARLRDALVHEAEAASHGPGRSDDGFSKISWKVREGEDDAYSWVRVRLPDGRIGFVASARRRPLPLRRKSLFSSLVPLLLRGSPSASASSARRTRGAARRLSGSTARGSCRGSSASTVCF